MNYKKLFLFGMFFISNIGLFGAEGGGEADGALGEPGEAFAAAQSQKKTIKVKIGDTGEFDVPFSVVNKMGLIKNMLNDLGEDDENPVPLSNVNAFTFRLLVAWIEQVGVVNSEERVRVTEVLKALMIAQYGEGTIEGQINAVVSLGIVADFLNVHIFEDEDTYSSLTMDCIAQVLVDLLMEHKEGIFLGAVSMPECLNIFHTDSSFAQRIMNLLERKKATWVFQAVNGFLNRSMAVHPNNLIAVASNYRGISIFREISHNRWDFQRIQCDVNIGDMEVARLAVFPYCSDLRLVLNSTNGRLKVARLVDGKWNVKSVGNELEGISVKLLAVDPKGNFFVSKFSGRAAQVWRENEGGIFTSSQLGLEYFDDDSLYTIESVAVFPDGTILSGCSDGVMRIWREVDGDWEICQNIVLDDLHIPIDELAVHPNGNSFVAVSGSRLVVICEKVGEEWKIQRLKTNKLFLYEPISHLAFHPNGDFFIVGFSKGSIHVWIKGESDEWRCQAILEVKLQKGLSSVGIFSDCRIVATFSGSDDFFIWSNPLSNYRNSLTLQQAFIVLCILQNKALPGVGTQAFRVWDSIEEDVRRELCRSLEIRFIDDAVEAAPETASTQVLSTTESQRQQEFMILKEAEKILENKSDALAAQGPAAESTALREGKILGRQRSRRKAFEGDSDEDEEERQRQRRRVAGSGNTLEKEDRSTRTKRSRREAFKGDSDEVEGEEQRKRINVEMPLLDRKTGASAAPSEEEVARFLAKEKEAEDDSDQEDD